jgi:hypothetical protein
MVLVSLSCFRIRNVALNILVIHVALTNITFMYNPLIVPVFTAYLPLALLLGCHNKYL